MKKLFSYIILILLSFSVSTYADDIRDFEIDRISIGDSLLNYFSKDKILNARNYDELPSDMKFRIIDIYTENRLYDGMKFYFIPNDKKFIIQSFKGKKYYSNINNCYIKLKKFEKEISNQFNTTEKYSQIKEKLMDDPTGKSTYTTTFFILDDGGRGSVSCYDWHASTNNKKYISVSIQSKTVAGWVDSNFGLTDSNFGLN